MKGQRRLSIVLALSGALFAMSQGCAQAEETMLAVDGGTDPAIEGPPCEPGSVTCDGTVARACRDDGLGPAGSFDCASIGKLCIDGVGCGLCTAGETRCDGNAPSRCKADGSGWESLTPCDASSGEVCAEGVCTGLCDRARATSSYIGCEYWAVPTANAMLDADFEFAVVIANPQAIEARVQITDGDEVTLDAAVPPGALETVVLPFKPQLKLSPYGYESVSAPRSAYRLASSVPVTVYQFNPLEYRLDHDCAGSDMDTPGDGQCNSYTNDASLLLPEHVLTGDYMAIGRPTNTMSDGYGTVADTPGFVAVAGTGGGPTRVTVTFSTRTLGSSDGALRAFERGETAVFTLQPHEVLQLLSGSPGTCMNPDDSEFEMMGMIYCNNDRGFDVTGTRISADRPVAVFSGHDCTFAPFNRWACDHLEEQVFPLQAWGREYVVHRSQPMFEDRPEPNLWKILSGRDGNVITFDPPSVHAEVALDAGEWIEFESGENFKATGTEGFIVAQFMVGMNYYGIYEASPDGDPAMSLAVPIEQYRDAYTFLAPTTYERSFVNLTAPLGSERSILIDGAPVPGPWTPIGDSGFVGTSVEIAGGAHAIAGDEPFGIIVYGVSDYTSYMVPGGMDLEKIFVI